MANRLPYMALSLILCAVAGFGQQASSDADLYGSAARENDPAKKMALLDQWTAAYPESSYKEQRNLQYISAYSMLAAAATNADAAATTMIGKADALFATGMMPAGVKDADWIQAKREFLGQAHGVLATTALKDKNYPAAETQLTALLDLKNGDPAISYKLGQTIVAERQIARYPEAIFHLARAVAVIGPGAFNDVAKKSMEEYLENLYSNYHGDLMGLDEVKRTASAAWTPPPGWTIESVTSIAQAKIAADTKFAQEHPELVVWRNLKARLTAVDGEAYFAAEVRGAEIPGLKGRVTARPDAKTLVLVMDDVEGGEATLRLDAALKGPVAPETVVEFNGTPLTFEKNPFRVVFHVDKTQLRPLP